MAGPRRGQLLSSPQPLQRRLPREPKGTSKCLTGSGVLNHHNVGMGQNYTTRGPQVLVLVSFSRVPFWVPIFDPHPSKCGKLLSAITPFHFRSKGSPNRGLLTSSYPYTRPDWDSKHPASLK